MNPRKTKPPKPPKKAAKAAKASKVSTDLVMLDELCDVMQPGTMRIYSDYFRTTDPFDSEQTWVYGAVLSLIPKPFAGESLPRFWGVGVLPPVGGPGTSAVVVHPQMRRSDSWVRSHISNAEQATGLAKREASSQGARASTEHKMATSRMASDIEAAAAQIVEGSSYHAAAWHVVLYAPTLGELDDYVRFTGAYYKERFASLGLHTAPGLVRKRLSRLLDPTGTAMGGKKRKAGSEVGDAMADGASRLGLTSDELSGSYSLVTGALTDVPDLNESLEPDPALIVPVGTQVGDYSAGAVLIDFAKMESHSVIGSKDNLFWTKLISAVHAADGSHVVHIVLDSAHRREVLDSTLNLGTNVVSQLDLSKTSINLMEIFGPAGTELDAYARHLERFTSQAFWLIGVPKSDAATVRAQLRDKLTQFYVDKKMWYRNAKTNLDRLRLLGLPHGDIPVLHDLLSYFQTAYKALSGTLARDNEALHAVSLLASGVRDVVDTYGDLFDQPTSPEIDLPTNHLADVYDLSTVKERGWQVQAAMLSAVLAQVLARAAEPGADPRTVIIHGAHMVTDINSQAIEADQPQPVAEWIAGELDRLKTLGGKVVWSFDNPREVLAAANIVDLVGADYTLLAGLSETTLSEYAKIVDADPSPAMVKLSTGANSEHVTALKRGQSVVCFEPMVEKRALFVEQV
jgi:hypothetical protein